MIEHIHACHKIRDEEAVPKKQKQEEESGEADDSPSCFSNCDLFHVAADDCGVSQEDGTDAQIDESPPVQSNLHPPPVSDRQLTLVCLLFQVLTQYY